MKLGISAKHIVVIWLLFITSKSVFAATQVTNDPLEQSVVATTVYVLGHNQAAVLPSSKVFSLSDDAWHQQTSNSVRLNKGRNWLIVDIESQSIGSIQSVIQIQKGNNVVEQQFFIQQKNQLPVVYNSARSSNGVIYSTIELTSNNTTRIYIYLNMLDSTNIAVQALTPQQYNDNTTNQFLVIGISCGGLFATTLMLLCISWANNNKAVFLLASYFFIQTVSLMVLYGFNLLSVFPQIRDLHGIELPVLTSLSTIFILWAISELFKLAYSSRKIYWLFQIVGLLMMAFIGISLLLSLNSNLLICLWINIGAVVLQLILLVLLSKSQNKLTLCFAVFVFIQVLTILANIYVSGLGVFNPVILSVGHWLSVLAMMFLLARQAALQINEKHSAQREALQSAMESRQANENLIALQAEDQEQLEARVQERTLELNIALQELEEVNRELEQKNTLDELTGLFNRRFYDQKILAEFRRSRRNLTPLSIVIVDIDKFKNVNDSFGHTAGDQCLIGIAKFINTVLRRSSDVGCRYGGEEFCMILPETSLDGAIAIADELRLLVESSPISIENHDISLTISCGVSTYSQQAQAKPIDIFNAADAALYQAKNNGRNQIQHQNIVVPE